MYKALFVYLLSLIAGFSYGIFRRVSNQKKITGIITDLKQKYKNQTGRTTYTGIIKYNVSGREYITETSFQAASYRIGKKVVIYYNAENPSESFVRAPIVVYLFVYFLVLLGTILLLKETYIYISRG